VFAAQSVVRLHGKPFSVDKDRGILLWSRARVIVLAAILELRPTVYSGELLLHREWCRTINH
jgi:hypothetical protein